MKKTILFDFDGVIVDSFEISFELSKMFHPTLTLESYNEKWKTNIHKAVFTEPKINVEIDFQHEYAKKMKNLTLSPIKKRVLQDLSERFDFHIISSTNTKTIKDFCEANEIHHYFGDILGADVAKGKVEKFMILIEKYNLDTKETIFVTDTVGDIEEAKEAGLETIIAVADGYQDKETLQNASPTYVIDSIANLEEVV